MTLREEQQIIDATRTPEMVEWLRQVAERDAKMEKWWHDHHAAGLHEPGSRPEGCDDCALLPPPIMSPFTRRALAGELPAKASYGTIDARDGGRLDR